MHADFPQAWRQLRTTAELEGFIAGPLRTSAVSLGNRSEAGDGGGHRRLRGGSTGGGAAAPAGTVAASSDGVGGALYGTEGASQYFAVTQVRAR